MNGHKENQPNFLSITCWQFKIHDLYSTGHLLRSGLCIKVLEEPEIAHFQAAKKILCSLSRTCEYGLFFPSRNTTEYHIHANTDWGRDLDSRYSTSRVVHKLGNSTICWSSKLQATIALSSTESKYRVLTDAAKDVICFRRLLQELCIGQTEPTTFLSDNQSIILPISIGPF